MQASHPDAGRSHIERLMEIATTLADYTQSSDLVAQIPGYLSRILELEPLTLAVVRQSSGTEAAEIVLLSSSAPSATAEPSEGFKELVRELYTQPQSNAGGMKLRSPFVDETTDTGFVETAVANLDAFPRAVVFSRPIDDQHRMCLILHRRAQQAMLGKTQLDALTLVAGLLAKLLRCLIAWQDHPELLGSAFERLTDREWIILRNLNSEEGEKQLADRLSLSPHTLHSHVKSIYRKVGVQGRLPLLLRFHGALRELRNSVINSDTTRESRGLAVSAG